MWLVELWKMMQVFCQLSRDFGTACKTKIGQRGIRTTETNTTKNVTWKIARRNSTSEIKGKHKWTEIQMPW